MSKVLKQYTIVPSNLYVNRDADRQLKLIVKDMGRPGYVLVSRQMGKTNLLLHAKRTLENENCLFVYVDLSNHFDNVRDCFNNIVDVAIDSHSNYFTSLKEKILFERKNENSLPAHKQHLSELRCLLNIYQGKIIIILDEIDALTKAQYSDQIFAQIRSIYFSRVNYPEYERLTYILSGVVEPSEIIKDPKISPFNIGQKIFLNDFTKEEFSEFLKKSNLELPKEVSDRIRFWTNGNPRMTWDIASEIETNLKKGIDTADDVDEIVKRMYLTTFDRPPIDNIREILLSNRDLRKYFHNLIEGKSDNIPDHIKSRLYLTGIVNYFDKDITLKNNIIKESLSLQWLESIDLKSVNLLEVANEYYEKGDFLKCLNIFEEFMQQSVEMPSDQEAFTYSQMGKAAFNLGDYQKASFYYGKCNFKKADFTKYYFEVLYYKGLSNSICGYYDSAISDLTEYVAECKKDMKYFIAQNNIGFSLLQKNGEENLNKAEDVFLKLLEDLKKFKDTLDDKLYEYIRTLINFNYGNLHFNRGMYLIALDFYNQALASSSDLSKPEILYQIFKASIDNKKENLNKLIDFIVQRKLSPIDSNPEKLSDFSIDSVDIILYESFLVDKEETFVKFLEYSQSAVYTDKNIPQILYAISFKVLGSKINDWEAAKGILELAYGKVNEMKLDSSFVKFQIISLLIFIDDGSGVKNYYLEYFELIKHTKDFVPSDVDIENYRKIIYMLGSESKLEEALESVSFINQYRDVVNKYIRQKYIWIDGFEMQFYGMLHKKDLAFSIGKRILADVEDMRARDREMNESVIDSTTLTRFKEFTNDYINNLFETPVVKFSFGRNEIVKVRYTNGTVVQDKFKRLENHIKQMLCVIID